MPDTGNDREYSVPYVDYSEETPSHAPHYDSFKTLVMDFKRNQYASWQQFQTAMKEKAKRLNCGIPPDLLAEGYQHFKAAAQKKE